jgi:hypothetical protein
MKELIDRFTGGGGLLNPVYPSPFWWVTFGGMITMIIRTVAKK